MSRASKAVGKGTLQPWVVGGVVLIIVFVLYWPMVGFQYVNYDDPKWIFRNPHVIGGISLDSLRWAMTGVVNSTWCPLTNVSFIVESSLFGVQPAVSHFINFALHAVNVLLLLRFLLRFMECSWPAALVTLLFAMHPMNVEAVAWVSERKGLLSTLFLLLLLTNYFNYAKAPSRKTYFKMVLLYGLSLASKPAVVTVPVMLFLFDVWPLARFNGQPGAIKRLVIEKIPFFFLAACDALIVFKWQHDSGDIPPYPFLTNVQTAIVGCSRYIANLVWPMDLNVCYLHPGAWTWLPVLSSAFLLALCGAMAGMRWRQDKKPLVCLGLFILGLAPVLQLIPAGNSYMADRFAYVPYIWLFIIIAPLLHKLALKMPIAIIPLGIMVCVTRHQLATWENSTSVFERVLAVNPDNSIAHVDIGLSYFQQGNTKQAIDHINKAIKLGGDDPTVQLAAAQIYEGAGQDITAGDHYRKAYDLCKSQTFVSNYARFALTHPNLGETAEGLKAARLAIELDPSANTLDQYAIALAACRRFELATQFEREAVALDHSSLLYQKHLAMFVNNQSVTAE